MKKIYCCRWMIACARAKEDTSYCCCQSWSWPSLPRRCRRCFELPFILFYGRFFRCASHPTTHPRFICTLDIGKALDFIGLTLPFSLRPETGNLGAQDRELPNLPPTSPTNQRSRHPSLLATTPILSAMATSKTRDQDEYIGHHHRHQSC